MTTDNKALAVDVLAVMDSAHYLLTLHVWDPLLSVDRDEQQLSREARDAIAELIEACESLQQHPDDLEIQADFCRALARVKGESA